jgi:putative flavoprotein involved in K+ transport
MDVARRHRTWVSGRDTGHIPFRIDGLAARLFLQRLALRFVFHRVLTIRTPMGRKARPKILSQGGPLIRTQPADLAAAGVERVPKLMGVRDKWPQLQDGRVLDVSNVIWCTGFSPGFSWIHLPVLDKNEIPKHDAGVAIGEPGLYFVGLPFIYAFSSAMIHGVGRDAERIAKVIQDRLRNATPEPAPLLSAAAR